MSDYDYGIKPYSGVNNAPKPVLNSFRVTIDTPLEGYTMAKTWRDIPIIWSRTMPSRSRFENEKLRDRAISEVGGRVVGFVGNPSHTMGGPVLCSLEMTDGAAADAWDRGKLGLNVMYRDQSGTGSYEQIPLLVVLMPR